MLYQLMEILKMTIAYCLLWLETMAMCATLFIYLFVSAICGRPKLVNCYRHRWQMPDYAMHLWTS